MADDLSKHLSIIFNPFVPNAPFLYPLMMFSGGREKVQLSLQFLGELSHQAVSYPRFFFHHV